MKLYIDTKPTLEWADSLDGHKSWADVYEIQKTADCRYLLIIAGYVDDPYYRDSDQAKAAAQADYVRRTAERFRKVDINLHNDLMYLNDILENFNSGNHPMVRALIYDWIQNISDIIKSKGKNI